jgi:hypothetical protein
MFLLFGGRSGWERIALAFILGRHQAFTGVMLCSIVHMGCMAWMNHGLGYMIFGFTDTISVTRGTIKNIYKDCF